MNYSEFSTDKIAYGKYETEIRPKITMRRFNQGFRKKSRENRRELILVRINDWGFSKQNT